MSHCKHLVNSINNSIYSSIVTYYVAGAIFNLHNYFIQWILMFPLLSLFFFIVKFIKAQTVK